MAYTRKTRSTEGLATSGADVIVQAAAPPSNGQVLTATSPTAANWQTPSGGGGGFTASRVHVYSSAQALALGDDQDGSFPYDTALFDTAGMFNINSPQRITVQAGQAGGWTVKANIVWPNTVGGYRRARINQFSSGDVLKGTAVSELPPSGSPNNWSQPAIGVFECAVGDYFTVEFYQNSGGFMVWAFGGTPYELYLTAVYHG